MKDKRMTNTAAILERSGVALLLAALLAGCAIGPMTAKDWAHKGYSRLEAGDYEGSIDAYTRAIEMDPTRAVMYENRGVCYSRLGDQQQALADFKKVLSMNDPKVPLRDTYREMGVAYYRMGRIDDAIAVWKKGVKKAPSDPGLLNNLAVAYMQQKRYDEATSAAQEAFTADPSIPEVLNTMGEVSMVKKDYEAAVKYFTQAIKRDPKNPSRYWNAARALEQEKQYQKALEYATRYSEMATDTASRQKAYTYIESLKEMANR